MRADGSGRVALVIEDDWLLRADIVVELRTQGWTVLASATAEDALALSSLDRLDVVITDIELAGRMDGWDAAESLRAVIPEVAVIYTSGNCAGLSRCVAGSLLFDKPYDTTAVIRACERLAATP